MKPTALLTAALLIVTCAIDRELRADTQLTTLPPRGAVRIDLANSGQALVEEDRTINLVAGTNRVDFSWAGTQIHKDSLQIRVLRSPGPVEVLSASYPPQRDALFWDVYAAASGPTEFRISYLIAGFERRFDYLALASRDETHVELQCRANLANNSGESFAKSLLQLGSNLTYEDRPMLTGQVRKMLAFRGQEIPMLKTYVFHPQQGANVRYFYTFENRATSGSDFGTDTLANGKARVYIRDSDQSETFLGEDWLRPVPVGGKAALYLGVAQDVKCKHSIVSDKKEQILHNRWYHQQRTARWTLENFKDDTLRLTIEQPMSGEWTLDNVKLLEERGEREERIEVPLDLESVEIERAHNGLLRFHVSLPATGKRKVKWNLYAKYTLKNRGF